MFKEIVKKSSLTMLSNFISLVSGIIVTFFLPKIMTVASYGEFKIFLLYASYSGLFHFGFIDGIYLRYSGNKYSDLDKSEFKYYTWFLFILQCVISIFIVLGSLCIADDIYKNIFFILATYILIHNMSSFFLQVIQMTQRYVANVVVNLFYSVARLLSIFILLFLIYNEYIELVSTNAYLLVFISLELFLLLLSSFFCRQQLSFFFFKIQNGFSKSFGYIKSGFPILLSGLVSTVILNLDRQFVSLFFPIEVYAEYAFSYTILSLFTTIVSSISLVVYPLIKENIHNEKKLYFILSNYVLIFVFGILMVVPLIDFIIQRILPAYSTSIIFFKILLPGLAVSCVIETIIKNYFKLYDYTRKYFILSLFILFLSFVLNTIINLSLKNLYLISYATVVSFFVWYLSSLIILKSKLNFIYKKGFLYAFVLSVLYYLCFILFGTYLSLFIYFIIYICCSIYLLKNNCYV